MVKNDLELVEDSIIIIIAIFCSVFLKTNGYFLKTTPNISQRKCLQVVLVSTYECTEGKKLKNNAIASNIFDIYIPINS